MKAAFAALALVCSVVAARDAGAQDWRVLHSARQLHDSGAYDVRVKYATGHLHLMLASAPFLYQMDLRYDSDKATPLHSFEEDRVLTLGVERESSIVKAGRSADENRMELALSPAVPIDLSLELGAVEAELDLGGLALTSLDINAGANATRVRFDTPNRVAMRSLEVEAGAASIVLSNIANANAALLSVEAGVGSVELDFSGAWTSDLAASVDIALGSLKLLVPRDVGVRLDVGKVLARVNAEGLVSRDGVLVSENWDTAHYKLTVRAKTVFGTIDVRRIPR
jgi:hypothetical protein